MIKILGYFLNFSILLSERYTIPYQE